tara:strand:+ start:1591 stop:1941 length:351 start_codon:yes stop_codon:yes gene_type:complete
MAWEIAIVLSLVGVGIALFYMGSNLQNDHYALKLLFLFLGLFLLLANLGILPAIIDANSATIGASIATDLEESINRAYVAMLYSTYFVLAYFMIYFLRQIFTGMGESSGKFKSDKF